ncbi:MAG: hypothetical protein AAF135_14150 [Bacteroidota bacterium]
MFGFSKKKSKSRAIANRVVPPKNDRDAPPKVEPEMDDEIQQEREDVKLVTKEDAEEITTPVERVDETETVEDENPEIPNPGKFLGYTMGGEGRTQPTLYFENGHYTQEHEKPKNVGWHPNKGERHFIANVEEKHYEKYGRNRQKWGRKDKTKFGKKVEKGKYDAKPGEGLMIEGNVKTKVAKNWRGKKYQKEQIFLHPSRGRLIKPGDEEFDEKYSEAYAKEVLKDGKKAKNEV